MEISTSGYRYISGTCLPPMIKQVNTLNAFITDPNGCGVFFRQVRCDTPYRLIFMSSFQIIVYGKETNLSTSVTLTNGGDTLRVKTRRDTYMREGGKSARGTPLPSILFSHSFLHQLCQHRPLLFSHIGCLPPQRAVVDRRVPVGRSRLDHEGNVFGR